jgi:hypothetical protein
MLPRIIPFRTKFTKLGRTKAPAARQPDHFKWKFVKKERPLLCQPGQFKDELPAVSKWFLSRAGQDETRDGPGRVKLWDEVKELDNEYFEPSGDVIVPLEKLTHEPGQKATFERFEAPLFVFLGWNRKKLEDPTGFSPHTSLYLAQCSLNILPKDLQKDLPKPEFVTKGGKDVYASSLWMGVPPTNTPLHRDPNPNLFIQLAGRKKIRMIKPPDGDQAYQTIRNICAEEEGTPPFAGQFMNGKFAGFTANMRGDEMMVGLEKKIMDSLIWGDENGLWNNASKDEHGELIVEKSVPVFKGLEAELGPGDGCFIPTGWWHSLRGLEEEVPGINASVNWWFR